MFVGDLSLRVGRIAFPSEQGHGNPTDASVGHSRVPEDLGSGPGTYVSERIRIL